ncbi:MAG: hypothetical protein IPL91_14980 [Hyphomicrobium sp.]|nr:hypothetical protein [Hyphomicrobium sp.]
MPQIGVGVGIGRRRRRGSGVGVQPILIGRQSGVDYGTTGDWFVDQSRPTSGDGLSLATAFKTITEAVTAASRGQRIKVATGTYRETATLTGKGGASPASPLRIEPYGTAEPIITGGEPLAGWALCSAGDAADVGPNWGSIYKVTVATSSFVGSNPRAAFPCEAGALSCRACGASPIPPVRNSRRRPKTGTRRHRCRSPGRTRPRRSVSHAFRRAYTQAQIERCDIWFRGQANFCYRSPITSFNPATGVITPTRQDRLYELEDRFALMNLLPEMRPGEWGWKDAGGGNTTLYIWPNNAANVAAGVEYTARGRGVFVDQRKQCRNQGPNRPADR